MYQPLHAQKGASRLARHFVAASAAFAIAGFGIACAPADDTSADSDATVNADVGYAAAGDVGHGAQLGAVSFEISCSPEAQEEFERGVALLHHMMYVESRAQFEALAQAEPECGMAHWGIAMTLFQPLWPTRPSATDLMRGYEEVQLAKSAGELSERERLFIEAAEGFYRDPESAGWPTRLERFAVGMMKVHEAYPDDPEAGSLWALSQLATAASADDPGAQRAAAAEVLAAINAYEPTHPGSVHYTIHANDVDGRADMAVDITRSYNDIAPAVPHALHMPTHIFVRLGEWDEVIDWNRRSADAALEHPAGEYVSHHFPHAIDYLEYAYLQKADDAAAMSAIDELAAKSPYQETFISAFHLASTPARYRVELRQWADAAQLEPRQPESFPWDRFPATEAITWFARGLGAARSGDASGAWEAEGRLTELRDAVTAQNEAYWATQVEIQRMAVEAWAQLAARDTDVALRTMNAAAELEATTEKHPITPGALQPAYELLGDMYLELDRPADALAAYERSLEMWPRRFNSLIGAARAARGAGQGEVAAAYYTELLALATDSSGRAGLDEARKFVASG